MILVVGATGILGSEICRQLRAHNRPVRALVRAGSQHKAAGLGVEIVVGDIRNQQDVDAACTGVTTVISTATAMGARDKTLKLRDIDHDGQLRLVQSATTAKVRQFIYLSASPNLSTRASLIRYKREVEQAIRSSGMRFTILQPSVFMEVWLTTALGWDIAAGKAMIFGDGKQPLSWISVVDVATHAIRALDDPRLENQPLPLGGPRQIPPNEVVRIFEQASRRPYKAKHIPRAVLRTLGPIIGLFNEMAASGMSMGADSASGDRIDSPLQRTLGLPLTTVEEYAAQVASGAPQKS